MACNRAASEEFANKFDLCILHDPQLGSYVRTRAPIGVDEDSLGFTAESPSILAAENDDHHLCHTCYHPLPEVPIVCPQCPQAYCSVKCQGLDRCHPILCPGRGQPVRNLLQSLADLEEGNIYTMGVALFGIQMAIQACVEALAADTQDTQAPLHYLQPLNFHNALFSRPEMHREQDYKAHLADVFFCLLECCFGPKAPFHGSCPPPWMTFTGFARLCSVLQCNAFQIDLGELDDCDAPTGLAIFPFHSMLAHSCEPNCDFLSALVPNGPPFIALKALQDIAAGDALTISYAGRMVLENLGGVVGRRAFLCALREFVCLCPRCCAEAAAARPQLLATKEPHPIPAVVLQFPRPVLQSGLLAAFHTLGRPIPGGDELELLDREALARLLVDAVVDGIIREADAPATSSPPRGS